jgi:energy-coupling factor transporter transmembrane protein EcfT
LPGAYVPGATPAHLLDARVKTVLLLGASVASFGASTPLGFALAAAGLVTALTASKTSLRTVALGLRPTLVVLAFSLLANAVVLAGQPQVSLAGLARGALAVGRIALVVGFALVFSATTMPPAIADACAGLMSPLARVGVPVGSVAMVISVALRFIPLTVEEVERIRCAQRARGARLDEGGVVRRLRGWTQVLVPLLVGLFRRADELACAMADRCYTGEQTSMTRPLTRRDRAVLLGGLAWVVVTVLA